MHRFRFRLERLLHLRKIVESEQARVLHELAIQEDLCRSEYEASIAERDRMAAQSGAGEQTSQFAGTLANQDLVRQAADRKVDCNLMALRAAEQKSRDEVRKYREARRDRRVVEMMKERQRERWETEMTREQQKEFDEIAGRTTPDLIEEVE